MANGYRGFASRAAYERHYSNFENWKDELPAMQAYAREAEEERNEAMAKNMIEASLEADEQRKRAETARRVGRMITALAECGSTCDLEILKEIEPLVERAYGKHALTKLIETIEPYVPKVES